jgi:hypothetical protein
MNTIYFPLEVSILLTLFAAAMWGSWMQIVNHVDDYPITGVIFWLYGFSLVLVLGVTVVLAPVLMPGANVWALILENPQSCLKILMGGALMSLGLMFNLTVMSSIGMILATTVGGSISTILGIGTSIATEGLPGGPASLPFIILTTALFIIGSFLSSYASHCRDKERGNSSKHGTGAVTGKMLVLMLLSSILVNGWAIGTSEGTAKGMPPVLTVVLMATGSFLSVALVSAIEFTRKKQWRQVLCLGRPKKPIVLSAISACCHYGGNLISIYSMPAISATISFLLGKSAALWTIFWGVFYKEFSGVSAKTRRILWYSIALHIVGIIALAFFKVN